MLFSKDKKGDNIVDIVEFTDGSSVTHFVGKKSLYANKGLFYQAVKQEFEDTIKRYFNEAEREVVGNLEASEIVHDTVYCRYYPRFSEDYSHLGLDGGYAFCNKGRGAFEVYVVNFEELEEKVKALVSFKKERESEINQ